MNYGFHIRRHIKKLMDRSPLLVRPRRSIPFGVFPWMDIRRLLDYPSRPTIFDVGAHTGETADSVLEMFPGASLHCFEPSPKSFSILKSAVKNATHHQLALSDKTGHMDFFGDGTGSSNRLMSAEAAAVLGKKTRKVEVKTLDQVMCDLGLTKLDVLKIDVEGFETSVLKGGAATIESCSPLILTECAFKEDSTLGSFDELRETLRPFGYHVACFYTAAVGPAGWKWGDVLFMPAGLNLPAAMYGPHHPK